MPFDPDAFNADLAASGIGPKKEPEEPFLSKAWDTVTTPLKALTAGQNVGAQLAGLLSPEAYQEAADERTQQLGIKPTDTGVYATLKRAEALPGLGDVLLKTELGKRFAETPYVGKVAPFVSMAGNIAGDPLTYAGGLGALTKLGRAEGIVQAASKAVRAAELAGDADRLAEAQTTLATVAELAKPITAEAGRGARFLTSIGRPGMVWGGAKAAVDPTLGLSERLLGLAHAGLALPTSPAVGLAYLPEQIEGAKAGFNETARQLQQGNVGEAVGAGVNTALQAGLAALTAKGLIHEVDARNAYARAMNQERPLHAQEEAAAAPPPEAAPAEAPQPQQPQPTMPLGAATPGQGGLFEPQQQNLPGTGAGEGAQQPLPLEAQPTPEQQGPVGQQTIDFNQQPPPEAPPATAAPPTPPPAPPAATAGPHPLLQEALAFVEAGNPDHTSTLQRRFRIGYKEAVRLQDEVRAARGAAPAAPAPAAAPPPPAAAPEPSLADRVAQHVASLPDGSKVTINSVAEALGATGKQAKAKIAEALRKVEGLEKRPDNTRIKRGGPPEAPAPTSAAPPEAPVQAPPPEAPPPAAPAPAPVPPPQPPAAPPAAAEAAAPPHPQAIPPTSLNAKKLRSLGWSDEEIARLSPSEAYNAVDNDTPPPSQRGAAPPAEAAPPPPPEKPPAPPAAPAAPTTRIDTIDAWARQYPGYPGVLPTVEEIRKHFGITDAREAIDIQRQLRQRAGGTPPAEAPRPPAEPPPPPPPVEEPPPPAEPTRPPEDPAKLADQLSRLKGLRTKLSHQMGRAGTEEGRAQYRDQLAAVNKKIYALEERVAVAKPTAEEDWGFGAEPVGTPKAWTDAELAAAGWSPKDIADYRGRAAPAPEGAPPPAPEPAPEAPAPPPVAAAPRPEEAAPPRSQAASDLGVAGPREPEGFKIYPEPGKGTTEPILGPSRLRPVGITPGKANTKEPAIRRQPFEVAGEGEAGLGTPNPDLPGPAPTAALTHDEAVTKYGIRRSAEEAAKIAEGLTGVPQEKLAKGGAIGFNYAPDSPAGRVVSWIRNRKGFKGKEAAVEDALQEKLTDLIYGTVRQKKRLLPLEEIPEGAPPDVVEELTRKNAAITAENEARRAATGQEQTSVTTILQKLASGDKNAAKDAVQFLQGALKKQATTLYRKEGTAARNAADVVEALGAQVKGRGAQAELTAAEHEGGLAAADAEAEMQRRLSKIPQRTPNEKRDVQIFQVSKVPVQDPVTGQMRRATKEELAATLKGMGINVSPATAEKAARKVEMSVTYPTVEFGNNNTWKSRDGALKGTYTAEGGTPARLTIERVNLGPAQAARDVQKMVVGLTEKNVPRGTPGMEIAIPQGHPVQKSQAFRDLLGERGNAKVPDPFFEPPLERVGTEGGNDIYRVRKVRRDVRNALDDAVARESARVPSEHLSPEDLQARANSYAGKLDEAFPVRDTSAVTVDFDGDASHSLPGHAELGPLANALDEVTRAIGEAHGAPDAVQFGGFTPSAHLDGLYFRGKHYVNAASAVQWARSLLQRAGQDTPENIARVAATRLVSTSLHEVLHGGIAGHGPEFAAQRLALIKAYLPKFREGIDRVAGAMDVAKLTPLADDLERRVNALERGPEPPAPGRPTAPAPAVPERTAPLGGAGEGRPGRYPGGGYEPPRAPLGGNGRAVGGPEGPPAGAGPAAPGGGAGATSPRKAGPSFPLGTKGYAEQRFPHSEPVEVRWPDGSVHYDEVKGLNKGHALARAQQNWPGAEVRPRPEGPFDQVSSSVRESKDAGEALANSIERGVPNDAARDLAAFFKGHDEKLKTPLEDYLKAGPQKKVDIPINMQRLIASDDIKPTIASIVQELHGDRGGPLTWDMIDRQTREMLGAYAPEELIPRLKASGLRTPTEVNVARRIYATYIDGVDKANKALIKVQQSGGSEAALAAAQSDVGQAMARLVHAQNVIAPGATTAGRILNVFRMMAEPIEKGQLFEGRFKGALRQQGLKAHDIDRLYALYNDAIKGNTIDHRAFLDALNKLTAPSRLDKVLEFWKAGLLGWPTQVANISSNALFQSMNRIEEGLAVGLDVARSKITGGPRERFAGELPARIAAQRKAMTEGFRQWMDDMVHAGKLEPADLQRIRELGEFDPRRVTGAIGGKWGEFVRLPFKSLDAADNFFKYVAKKGEMAARAHRLDQMGKFASHFKNEAEILNALEEAAANPLTSKHYNLLKDEIQAAEAAVKRSVFQAPLNEHTLGRLARTIAQGTQDFKYGQFLIPFTHTPANIIHEMSVRTPLGFLNVYRKWKKGQFKASGEVMDELAKAAMGSVAMGAALSAGLEGKITGGGPSDPNEQENLKATGWQPYSFKVGDQYFNYQRFEPMSSLLGMAGDMAEAYKRGEINKPRELFDRGFASVAENVTNKTFLSGLEAAFSAWHDPARYGSTLVKQLSGSVVPNILGPIPVATLAKAIDPKYRQTESFTLSPLIARIPGLSTTLPEQLTPLGEARERPGTFLERLLIPSTRTEVQTGPSAVAAHEFDRLGWAPRKPERVMKFPDGTRVELSPQELTLMAKAQQQAVEAAARIIQSPGYQQLPEQEDITGRTVTKRDVLQKIITQYQRQALARVKPAATARGVQQKREALL